MKNIDIKSYEARAPLNPPEVGKQASPAPSKGGEQFSPFEGGRGMSEPRFATRFSGLPRLNPANLKNLMKIKVQTNYFKKILYLCIFN